MAKITEHKYSIEEAFGVCFYVVPDYQREYVWTKKQVLYLLEDINEQMDESASEYFIGTILVSPQDIERNHYDVIDGQQRLTTIFLILCALKVLFEDESHHKMIDKLTSDSYTASDGDIRINLKLEPNYEGAGEVIKKIVDVNGTPQAVRSAIQSEGLRIYGSVEKILNAYEIIYGFLAESYDDEDKLKKYWTHLARNIVFIQISTQVSNALKIFETINERGVGLNPMDLLKNLLFIQVNQKDFKKLKDKWEKITGPLEKGKEKPLRFLRYFIMANYEVKKTQKDATVREDEIYDWFSDSENAELTGHKQDPFKFVSQVENNVGRYLDFSKGYGNDRKVSDAMNSLKSLAGGAFSQHYILLLAAANLPKTFFDQFVAQIESFLFFYIFTKSPTKTLEDNFSGWADEVRMIASLGNAEEQRKKLNDFVSERFAKNMEKKAPELDDALKRLSLGSMQKYRTQYLLARLTQHVDMAFRGQKDRGSLEPYYELEIEHILPDNPKDDLLKTWQDKHSNLDYDEYKNRLGNLTLLEKPLNAVASNNFYEMKLSEYKKTANYLTRSLSGLDDVGQNTSITRINEKLLAFEKWEAEDIEERQLLLIGLAREIWKTTEIT